MTDDGRLLTLLATAGLAGLAVARQRGSRTDEPKRVPNEKLSAAVLRFLLNERMDVGKGATKGELVSLAKLVWGSSVSEETANRAERKWRGSRGVVRAGRRETEPCSKHRAIEVLAEVPQIASMTTRQLARWEKDGTLICPHGKTDLRANTYRPVWNASDSPSKDKTLFVDGSQVIGELGGSPSWIECDCSGGSAFWPPDDLEIDFL